MPHTAARTHLAIDARLVGVAEEIAPGRAVVSLVATPAMAADERGLVHGGFVFGLADYAAMLAVNEPLVVLAAAECRFLAPAAVGDRLVATAERLSVAGRRHAVRVEVARAATTLFEGSFDAAVPGTHVLARREAREA